MSDLKGKLKDILNSTFGSKYNYQTTSHSRKISLIKSPRDDRSLSNKLDLSIDNFRRKKSKNRDGSPLRHNRSPSLTSSNLNTSIMNLSTTKSDYPNYNNYHNKFTYQPVHIHTRMHDLDLITPSTHVPFLHSKFTENKIKKEIQDLSKVLFSDNLQPMGYRNRPMLNVNRPDLEFNSRKYIANSPTVTRRGHLTTSDIFKNFKLGKSKHDLEELHTFTGKVSFSKIQASELEHFSKDFKFGKFRKQTIADRYPSSRRRESNY